MRMVGKEAKMDGIDRQDWLDYIGPAAPAYLAAYSRSKKVDKFQWTSEAQEALDALKKFLTTPPVLKPPRRATPIQPAEDLLLYISCTTHVVSTALVVERVEEGHAYPRQKGQGLCAIEYADRFLHRKIHLCKLSGFCLTTPGGHNCIPHTKFQ